MQMERRGAMDNRVSGSGRVPYGIFWNTSAQLTTPLITASLLPVPGTDRAASQPPGLTESAGAPDGASGVVDTQVEHRTDGGNDEVDRQRADAESCCQTTLCLSQSPPATLRRPPPMNGLYKAEQVMPSKARDSR
jgi:hypothetical protein